MAQKMIILAVLLIENNNILIGSWRVLRSQTVIQAQVIFIQYHKLILLKNKYQPWV